MAMIEPGLSYEGRYGGPELPRAVHEFQRALAAPAPPPVWRAELRQRLSGLRDRLTEHIVVTEGPDGSYAELLEHAPPG